MAAVLLTAALVSSLTFKEEVLQQRHPAAVEFTEGDFSGSVKWDANEHGVWGVWGSFENTKDALVVLGGDDAAAIPMLLYNGYIVWTRRATCSNSTCCREQLGYSMYLADTSLPPKPTKKYTAFLHGHLESWHQTDPLYKLLTNVYDCSVLTGRYSAVSWFHQISLTQWIEGNGFIDAWNSSSMQNQWPGPENLHTYLGGQFMVTENLIAERPMSFYKQLLAAIEMTDGKCELDGYQMEFFWGWIFSESSAIDPNDPNLYPQGICNSEVKSTGISLPTPSWNPRLLPYSFDTDGFWTYPRPAGDDNLRIMLVIGADPSSDKVKSLVERLVSDNDFGIWLRQPTHHCPYGGINVDSKNYMGHPPCSFTEGYSRFLNRFGGCEQCEDLMTDVFVFLSGEDDTVTSDDIFTAARLSVTRDGYYPVDREAKLHSSPTQVIPWPAQSGLRLPAKGFATSDFSVPSTRVYSMDRVRVEYIREMTIPLLIIHPTYFEFYWHFIFGDEPQLLFANLLGDPLAALCWNAVEDTSNLGGLHLSWFPWMDKNTAYYIV